MRPMYYDRDGKPYEGSLGEQTLLWAKDFETSDRRVRLTRLWGVGRVSTVWLGLNHNYFPGGRPLIYETMVFDCWRNFWDLEMWRYSSREEAIAGHKYLVKKWRWRIGYSLWTRFFDFFKRIGRINLYHLFNKIADLVGLD